MITELKDIKQEFFAYRNGMLADTLRDAGDSHKIIFGLNIPQIKAIADRVEKSADIAQQLWDNDTSRESRLAAPMVYPADKFSKATAEEWIASLINIEEADILCHRLLCLTDYAEDMIYELAESDNEMRKYCGYRLAINVIMRNKLQDYNKISELLVPSDKDSDRIILLKKSIAEEIEFKKGI